MNARWLIFNTIVGSQKAYYAKLYIGEFGSMSVPWVSTSTVHDDRDEDATLLNLLYMMSRPITPAKAAAVAPTIYKLLGHATPPKVIDDAVIKTVKSVFDYAWKSYAATHEEAISKMRPLNTEVMQPKEKPKKLGRKRQSKQAEPHQKEVVVKSKKKLTSPAQLQLL